MKMSWKPVTEKQFNHAVSACSGVIWKTEYASVDQSEGLADFAHAPKQTNPFAKQVCCEGKILHYLASEA